MTRLTIEISEPVNDALQRQAAAAGKPVEQYASEILSVQASAEATLADISGPMEEEFRKTGMSEEELAAQLEREDHESRGVPYP